jgi:hypothetical protein
MPRSVASRAVQPAARAEPFDPENLDPENAEAKPPAGGDNCADNADNTAPIT